MRDPGRIRDEDITSDPEGFDIGLRKVETASYDPTRHREWVRTILVIGVVAAGVLGVLATGTAVIAGETDTDTGLKVAGLLSPVFALATLAVGFYFRS